MTNFFPSFIEKASANASKQVANVASEVKNQSEILTSFVNVASLTTKALVSIFILIGLYLLAKLVANSIIKALRNSQGEALREDMIVFVNRFTVVIAVSVGVAMILQFVFGIDFLQIVGFFALGVSFAFKDLLENLIAGAVIIIQNTLRINDFISLDNGVRGKIKEIQTRQTILKGIDGTAIIIPNSKLMSGTVTSYSLHHSRRITFDLQLDYDESDLKKATHIILDLLSKKENILKKPKPQVVVASIKNSIIDLNVRFWIDPANNKKKSWLLTKSELLAEIKEAFDREGILIPYQTYTYMESKRSISKAPTAETTPTPKKEGV